MRQLRIDFVPDRRWMWVCFIALLVCCGLIGHAAEPLWQLHKDRERLTHEIGQLEGEIVALRKAAIVPTVPNLKHAIEVADLLQKDLNPPFNAIERMNESGALLKSFSLDVVGGTLRLEYEVESMIAVAAVTVALNIGFHDRPWQLESASGTTASPLFAGGNRSLSIGVPSAPAPQPNQKVRAFWSVRLSDIK